MAFEKRYLKGDVSLFENQKHNVKRLVHRRRALLSDKVGAGKTLSCLYSFAYLKEKGELSNMLVFTPLSAYEKNVWRKDIEKFTTLSCISVDDLLSKCGDSIKDLGALMLEYDVIYGKHTHIKSCTKIMKKICKNPSTVLVVDEVHAMKNPKTDITKACKELSRTAENFWGITGSTISKNLEDLYNIVNLISPWYFGSIVEFRNTWCECREKKIGWDPYKMKPRTALEIVGVKDEVAFRQKLEPILISGESFSAVKFHWLDYEMNDRERLLYSKISRGIDLGFADETDWLAFVLSDEVVDSKPRIKNIDPFSSRFIYLQSVVDGTLEDDGCLTGSSGTKIDLLLDKLSEMVSKGQSCIVYFDYLTSLDAVKKRLSGSDIAADVLESSGRKVIKDGEVTVERCKEKPVIILGTRASSESVSYYMINNVVFFNIPSVPHTFVQLVGRITRKNTLYPNDLNVYIFRSDNIDKYKMLLVSSKAYQMEIAQGREGNIPDDYKQLMSQADMRDMAKKVLLWGNKKIDKTLFS